MDELDLIRSFRAHTAPPTSAARARARRAWSPRESRRGSRPPIRRLALGASGLAVATALGFALLGGGEGRLSVSDARAAETLRSAAAEAEAHGLPAPRPGEYVYFRSRQAQRRSAGGYAWFERSIRESWMGADGALRTRVSAQPIAFAGPGARARWEAAGRPELSELPAVETHRFPTAGRKVIPFGGSRLTYPELLALPTGSAELYRRIRAAAAAGRRGLRRGRELHHRVRRRALRAAPGRAAGRLLPRGGADPGHRLLGASPRSRRADGGRHLVRGRQRTHHAHLRSGDPRAARKPGRLELRHSVHRGGHHELGSTIPPARR